MRASLLPFVIGACQPCMVTIDDVARAAGVSRKTVSRVLNGEAYVRDDKKSAILKAISDLGYKPNMAARSLAAGRSFLIGFLAPRVEFFHYYFHELHRQTIRASRDAGLHLVLEEVTGVDAPAMQRLETNLQQMRFDGVIVASTVSNFPSVLKLLERLNIRYVRMQPEHHIGRSAAVSANDAQGAKALAEHLVALGHRKIAIGHVGWRRHNLLKAALVKAGVDERPLKSIPIDWHHSAFVAGQKLCDATLALKKSERPTAVSTHADEVAGGFISRALDLGIDIPGEISVVGYDGGPIAESCWPGITTIKQPLEDMARQAMSLLLDHDKSAEPKHVVYPVELIARGSTAKVRPSASAAR